MYEHLNGRLVAKTGTGAVLDLAGVGYRLEISLRCAEQLPPIGQTVQLLVHHRIQDDHVRLFGFLNEDERTLFRQLLSVAGIGPAHALALLSGHAPGDVWRHIEEGSWKALATVKGIGPKIAQRACTELKDRARRFTRASGTPSTPSASGGAAALWNDAVGALLVLGYGEAQAQKAVEAAVRSIPGDATLEEVVREALKNA